MKLEIALILGVAIIFVAAISVKEWERYERSKNIEDLKKSRRLFKRRW